MNQANRKSTILKICITAVLAVLVWISSDFLEIQIPSIMGFDRFHLGNVMCALSGILLGPWWGFLAAGLGSALFDLMNPAFITDILITFVTKGLYGMVAGLIFFKVFRRKSNYAAELVSALGGAVTYIILYLSKKFFLDSMLLAGMDAAGAWIVVLSKLPSSLFNGVVAVIFAPILGVALNKALKQARLDRLLA